MFELWVNGVALDRWTVVRGFVYRPPVSVQASLVEVPGQHGVTAVGLPVFGEPQVPINLAPSTRHDPASLDAMLADLVATLASPALTLRRSSDGRLEEAPVRLVSFTPSDQWIEGRWARAVATLAVPGVFFRDLAPANTTVAAGSSAPTALAGSGPIGDAVVRWPLPSIQTFSLTDVVSGTGISVTPSSSNGSYLYVDVGALRAWRSNSSSQWTNPEGTTGEDAGVDFPPAGPLQLWPAPVVDDGKVTGRAVSLVASHAAVVRARRCWL